ncbi:unnamed protein product [Aphis gossypii]|uniref:Uncharacterized protein n=1 Tax=Aphis gossypii TaxID=80765 RepID=A0A9P0IZ42_APHGO|nr:unnamed protein product [Aphis gossypii]
MSENLSSRLKKLEEIDYLEDSDDTDADPDYVDCANEHIENEYDDSDDDFSESNRNNSKRSIIIPRDRSRSQSPLPEPSYYLGKDNITKCYTGNHLNIDDLWSDDGLVPPYFCAVMSKARFYIFLRTLRFDDIGTKATRKQIDKLTPILDILNYLEETYPHYHDYIVFCGIIVELLAIVYIFALIRRPTEVEQQQLIEEEQQIEEDSIQDEDKKNDEHKTDFVDLRVSDELLISGTIDYGDFCKSEEFKLNISGELIKSLDDPLLGHMPPFFNLDITSLQVFSNIIANKFISRTIMVNMKYFNNIKTKLSARPRKEFNELLKQLKNQIHTPLQPNPTEGTTFDELTGTTYFSINIGERFNLADCVILQMKEFQINVTLMANNIQEYKLDISTPKPLRIIQITPEMISYFNQLNFSEKEDLINRITRIIRTSLESSLTKIVKNGSRVVGVKKVYNLGLQTAFNINNKINNTEDTSYTGLKRNKQKKELMKKDGIVRSEDIQGYRGDKNIDEILKFIGDKSSDSQKNKINSRDGKGSDDDFGRPKNGKMKMTKYNSVENVSTTVFQPMDSSNDESKSIKSFKQSKKKVPKQNQSSKKFVSTEQRLEVLSSKSQNTKSKSQNTKSVTNKQKRNKQKSQNKLNATTSNFSPYDSHLLSQYTQPKIVKNKKRMKSTSLMTHSDKSEDYSDLDSVHSLPASSTPFKQPSYKEAPKTDLTKPACIVTTSEESIPTVTVALPQRNVDSIVSNVNYDNKFINNDVHVTYIVHESQKVVIESAMKTAVLNKVPTAIPPQSASFTVRVPPKKKQSSIMYNKYEEDTSLYFGFEIDQNVLCDSRNNYSPSVSIPMPIEYNYKEVILFIKQAWQDVEKEKINGRSNILEYNPE